MSYLQKIKRRLHGKRERVKAAESKSEAGIRPLEQASSSPALLRLLPFEVRHQIWKEFLGDNLFHMTAEAHSLYDPPLGRYLCRDFSTDATSLDGQSSYPRCQGSQREPCFFSGPEGPSFRPLSLLLTCKQIYNEAVALLYSCNTFNFDNSATLCQFMNLVTSHHSNYVRTVHVNTAMWKIRCSDVIQLSRPNSSWEAWTGLWRLLAKFKGLQHLRLDIYGSSKERLLLDDLEPLFQLRGLKTFDLAIWRQTSGLDLSLSVPLQDIIRSNVYKQS